MSFSFPTAGTEKHEIVGREAEDTIANWRALPTMLTAKCGAIRTIENNPMIAGVYSMVLMADDSVSLFLFGPRGGRKKVWDFGCA
jgi:hypothetical protein